MARIALTLRNCINGLVILVIAAFWSLKLPGSSRASLPNPPELRARNHTLSLTLHAGVTPEGKDAFYFNGQPVAPTLRLSPGDQLKIAYVNDLPTKSKETCAIDPCMDMSNLHFHGLQVAR